MFELDPDVIKNKRAMMALDRSPDEKLNHMLNVAMIWPSERTTTVVF